MMVTKDTTAQFSVLMTEQMATLRHDRAGSEDGADVDDGADGRDGDDCAVRRVITEQMLMTEQSVLM